MQVVINILPLKIPISRGQPLPPPPPAPAGPQLLGLAAARANRQKPVRRQGWQRRGRQSMLPPAGSRTSLRGSAHSSVVRRLGATCCASTRPWASCGYCSSERKRIRRGDGGSCTGAALSACTPGSMPPSPC